MVYYFTSTGKDATGLLDSLDGYKYENKACISCIFKLWDNIFILVVEPPVTLFMGEDKHESKYYCIWSSWSV